MPLMQATVKNYSGNWQSLNGTRNWRISQMMLTYSVISVGLPSFSAAFSTVSAVQFAFGKALVVTSAVDWTPPNLKVPASYRQLDQSDKVNISYWLGMAFTRIAANRILQVGNVIHAAPMKKQGLLTVAGGSGGVLGDLIGQDPSGNWHALEAKGRTSAPDAKTFTKWKRQVTAIQSINGMQTSTHTCSYLKTGGNYKLTLDDPDSDHNREIQLSIRDEAFTLNRRTIAEFVRLGNAETFLEGNVTGRQVGYDARTGSNVYVGVAKEVEFVSESRDNEAVLIGPDRIALVYRGGQASSLKDELVAESNDVETLNDPRTNKIQ